MAWIESHETLRHHPKTLKLARMLGIHPAQAVGHLHFLWWWCLSYAQDGNLIDYAVEEVALGAGWDGDSLVFIAAMQDAGFLDGMEVHDWWDYAGKLVDRRLAERERSRLRRTTAGQPTVDQRSTNKRPTVDQQTTVGTVHNPTVPYTTNTTAPNQPDVRAAAVAAYWQDNGFGVVGPLMLSDVDTYGDEHGMETALILYAIELGAAGTPEQRKWSYVRGILERFRKNGWKRRAEAEAHDRRRRDSGTPPEKAVAPAAPMTQALNVMGGKR